MQGVSILTSDRVRTVDNLAREKRLAGLRLVIESMISNLKCQMRVEQDLAKNPLRARAADRSATAGLTVDMLLNTLTGRPPPASLPMMPAEPTPSL